MEFDANALVFNVLIRESEGQCTAHCLELDIVAEGNSVEVVWAEIADLISIQVDYAFSNDNLDNLFHPAPRKVWQEFYACFDQEKVESKIEIQSSFKDADNPDVFVPPWVIAKRCNLNPACSA